MVNKTKCSDLDGVIATRNKQTSLLIDKKYIQQKIGINNMFMSNVFILTRHSLNYPCVQLNILTSKGFKQKKKSLCLFSKILFIYKFLSAINRVKQDVLLRAFFSLLISLKHLCFYFSHLILYIDYFLMNGMRGVAPSIYSWNYVIKIQTYIPDT